MLPSVLFALLLLSSAYSAPTSKEDTDKYTVSAATFPIELVRYTSQYDIVNIHVPTNSLNGDDSSEDNDGVVLFFVEADLKNKEEKGLYFLKDKTATMILPNGRDVASTRADDSKTVYFAAKDGVYKYNDKTKTAEKYGSVTDSLIGITMGNETDTFYILTEDKQVYKVTDDGNKKTKMDDVKNAQQIVMDMEDNLYYLDDNKQVFVVSEEGVKKIESLPEAANEILLLRPPLMLEAGIPAVVDDKVFIFYANGTVEASEIDVQKDVKPTACAVEGTLIIYIAKDKKIYEYNLLALVLGELVEELRKFLEPNASAIQELASKSKSEIVDDSANKLLF